MAFIHQGPRRKVATSATPDHPALNASMASATTSFHSLNYSTTSTTTFATASSSRTAGTSAQAEASQDWSLVFPGRSSVQRSVSTLSSDSQHGNGQSETGLSSPLVDVSTTLIPFHDGTGTFADYDDYGLDPMQSPPQTAFSESGETSTQGSDDAQAMGAPAFDLVFDDESVSDSSALPPSLTLSPRANTRSGRRPGGRSSQRGSEASAGSSAALLFSPTSPSALADDILDAVPDPEWSWEDQGELRKLTATTPRQRSPTRLSRGNLSRAAYASDSESESGDPSPALAAHPRRKDTASKPIDATYEDALADAPSAASAGLLPRRRNLENQGRMSSDIHSDDPPSLGQVSSSLGFKRRQRRQHKEGSVRSSKSRRSDSLAAISGTGASVKSSAHRRRRRHDTSAAAAKSPLPEENAATAAPARPGMSKKVKVARLVGRLLNVDGDVLDALLHDQGPLALTDADRTRDSPPPTHLPSFGFEHESAELVHGPRGARRWRELIDGRIVEDLEGEEEDEDETSSQIEDESHAAPQAHEPQDAALPISAALSNPTDPILALTSATLSAHDANDAEKLQELIRYALARMGTDGLTRGDLSAKISNRDGTRSNSESPEAQQALAPALTPAAVLSSTADALQGVMPYFVPFSWRLLVRLMREWNQGQIDEASGEEASNALPKVDAQPLHESNQQASPTTASKARNGRHASTSRPGTEAPRGRSTERKSLGMFARQAADSNPVVLGVESMLTTSSASTTRG